MNEAKGGAGAYLLVMLIAGGAGFYFGQQSAGAPTAAAVDDDIDCNSEAVKECANAEPIYKIPVGDAVFKGNKDALVTIVEISDFQCPFCSRVNKTLDDLMKGKYGKDIRIAFFHNPLGFHNRAMPAAVAAEAANRQGKFWEMHDKLFANTKNLTDANFDKWAGELGLNMDQFKKDMKDPALTKKVKDQQKLAVSLGARGTPAFFINGRFLSGAQPLSKFEDVVAKALKDANRQIKKGVAAKDVYAKLIAKGATSKVNKPAPAGAGAQPPARPKPPADTRQKVPVKQSYRGKGTWPAKVVIVEYSDFECPFCSRGAKTVEDIMKNHGKDVYFIYKHNPLGFHPNAEPAARACEAAGMQGKFFEMHDKMFADYKNLTQPNFEKWAKELGLNVAKFKKDMDSKKVKDIIKADVAESAKVGARGTPNFFVNGIPVRGALPYERFKPTIEAELKKADALLKKGVKLKDIYAEVMKEAGKPAPNFKLPSAPAKPKGPVVIDDHPEDMAFGPKSAKVTIYEFSDFQCPFCSKGADTITALKKEYGNKIRVVFKNLPLGFHQHAELAARAAHAAGKQGKFWQMHDKLFENYRNLGDELIKGYAKEVGLDMAKWEKDLNSASTKAKVEADKKLANKVGARGTPNFYINGEHLAGAQPIDRFKAIIDRELKK
jgi:protein-disulfide isomerase